LEIDFNAEKIIVPQRSKINTFGYSNDEFYASGDVYFITNVKEGYNLKFLLGVLNSNIIYIWLYNRGKRKGEMLELYQEPLSHIPIPRITSVNKKEVEQIKKLVDQILLAKKEDKDADTKVLEKEIDQIVYGLYNLTPGEIEILENSNKK
jgi:adenine-specific DNA-methyltransferase